MRRSTSSRRSFRRSQKSTPRMEVRPRRRPPPRSDPPPQDERAGAAPWGGFREARRYPERVPEDSESANSRAPQQHDDTPLSGGADPARVDDELPEDDVEAEVIAIAETDGSSLISRPQIEASMLAEVDGTVLGHDDSAIAD